MSTSGVRQRPRASRGRTVFIVGSGASFEVGLPTGEQLKDRISQLLGIEIDTMGQTATRGDSLILEAYKVLSDPAAHTFGRELESYVEAGRKVQAALPLAQSIDNYLQLHSGKEKVVQCGKLGIVRAILEAEATSTLSLREREVQKRGYSDWVKATWINAFFRLLTDNCSLADLPERLQSVSLIVFNYDRCIEHFLHGAFQSLYDIGADEAVSLVRQIEVFHPYGVAGNLEWTAQDNVIPFASQPNADSLIQLARAIRTFSEESSLLAEQVETMRTRVREAGRLVFLGFAFHRMNLDLLMPLSERPAEPISLATFGTALGLSDSDTAVTKQGLNWRLGVMPGDIQLRNDLTCSRLFHEYRLSLAIN